MTHLGGENSSVTSRPHDETGSVMMLIIGLVPIVFGLIAVGTDAAVLFTARRSLGADADAAALAGAQAADFESLYTGHKSATLALDCARSRRLVEARFSGERGNPRAAAAHVESMTCDGRSVTVTLRSTTRLPFASNFGITPHVTVRATATAQSPFR